MAGGAGAKGASGWWRASRAWARRALATNDDEGVVALIFRTRYVLVVLLAASALLLPAAGADGAALALTAVAVGFPFNRFFEGRTRSRGRVPVAMAYIEAVLPATVAVTFPVVWTPMLLLGVSNLSLHSVLFSRMRALTSLAITAATFALVGPWRGPAEWSLGVAAVVLVGVSMILVLFAVAEKERTARQRFGAMVEGVDAVLIEMDLTERRFTYVSHHVVEMLGYRPEEFLANDSFFIDHVHPDDQRRSVRAYLDAVEDGSDFELEFRMMAVDGRVLWCHARVNVEVDGGGRPLLLRGVVVDVTERRRAEEALRHQALHDALTGLPNRVLLHDRLRHGVATAARFNQPLALLLLDLDQFKEVNDTLGHEHGDRLLQQLGARLRRVLRDNDTVARLGGDEFAVIVEGADRLGAEIVAEKISAALEPPFALEDMSVQARASIGIALFPDQAGDAETLVQRADVAMYTAKRNGGGHAVYEPRQDRFSLRRLALIGDLRRALAEDELVLHFQPKLGLRSGEVIGVESLLRWQHPEHGLLGPDRFIALAEVSGLIQPLTSWVLDRALRQCRGWMNAGIDLGVAVNISARDLHDTSLPDRFAELFELWAVPADRLVVEITEHEIMRDRIQAAETLGRLAAMGVRVSIDDFGTGYSSLADLRHLPIGEIKIDRSFVAGMATDMNDAVIVRSIVDLGHNLGINVVAEGVENAEIGDWLDQLGCDELQGYHICEPLPAEELADWVAARRRPGRGRSLTRTA